MKTIIQETIEQALSKIEETILKQNDQQAFEKVQAVFLKANEELLQHASDMQEVYDYLCDEKSKKQYVNFLTYQLVSKVSRDFARSLNQNMPIGVYRAMVDNFDAVLAQKGLKQPALFPNPIYEQFGFEQYIYPPFVNLGKGDVFIDCGACFGDSAMWASQKGAEVHALEPISYIFKGLDFYLDFNDYLDVHCYNLGVSSKNQELTFKMSKSLTGCAFSDMASKQSKFQEMYFANNPCKLHDVKVQCVRLDDFLKDHNIEATFIKMDIEGAELDALKGATETLQQRKPKLAISLYHSDSDLWAIPLFIKSVVPEYKFYCRQNSIEHEFVLYATV